VRVAGVGHSPKKLARIAYRKHVRLARLEGAALGLGGIFTAAPDVVALIWIQSRMVFYVAAAYGYDPHDPMRPAELLVIQGLYDTPEDARRALDGMGKLMAHAMAEKALTSRHNDRLHRRLVKYIAKRMARRYAGRYIPLIGAPMGAWQNAGATKQVGKAALRFYARP
jgi:EcsC protein family